MDQRKPYRPMTIKQLQCKTSPVQRLQYRLTPNRIRILYAEVTACLPAMISIVSIATLLGGKDCCHARLCRKTNQMSINQYELDIASFMMPTQRLSRSQHNFPRYLRRTG